MQLEGQAVSLWHANANLYFVDGIEPHVGFFHGYYVRWRASETFPAPRSPRFGGEPQASSIPVFGVAVKPVFAQ